MAEQMPASLTDAAPDLYTAGEALVDLVEAWMTGPVFQAAGIRWTGPENHPPALRAMRAALAKADGR